MIMAGIKNGVQLLGMQPQTLLAMVFAMGVCERHNTGFTITSVCDGKHARASLHYKGLAFDMRIRDMTGATKIDVFDELKRSLGEAYDVVLENDHIHCEYDPKGK